MQSNSYVPTYPLSINIITIVIILQLQFCGQLLQICIESIIIIKSLVSFLPI